jgi:phosphonate metabolism protein PhnN/1,5-bisphosphokinase (PRPP-forming)
MLSNIANKGQLFLIVGNSGSGKDTLLKQVLRQWPAHAKPIRVPQRYITRPPHDSEPFFSLTPPEFIDLKQRNFFCLTWHVYGIDYGVPNSILDWLNQGQHVIVNVSRKIISQARKQIPDLKVIFVKVPWEVTLQRMRSRSRESENDPAYQKRLRRAKQNQNLADADFFVDNSGSLESAAGALIGYLLSFE